VPGRLSVYGSISGPEGAWVWGWEEGWVWGCEGGWVWGRLGAKPSPKHLKCSDGVDTYRCGAVRVIGVAFVTVVRCVDVILMLLVLCLRYASVVSVLCD
jgi:hypothetical protein